jgi:hypothetical protein
MSRLIPLAMRRGPNIIIHPSLRNGFGSTKSCFGRVMMSVSREKMCAESWKIHAKIKD